MRKVLFSIIFVLMMGMLTACGKVTIDLNDYVSIDVEGYDSMGSATYSFDTQRFTQDYGDKIKVKKQTEEIKLEQAFGTEPIDILRSYCIHYSLDNDSYLSNGDVIVWEWDCDVEEASECFGCKLKFEDIKYTVDGLKEVDSFNPFDYLTVEFSGTSPQALAEYKVDYSLSAMQYIGFSLSKSAGLELGEEIIATAYISNGMSTDEFAEKYNMIPGVLEKTYTVENIAYYLSDVSQIPQEKIDASIKSYYDYYTGYVNDNWMRPETLQSIDYIGYYFLKPKDSNYYTNNYFYMIFKVNAIHPVSGEPVEFYTYGYYGDVLNDGEEVIMKDGIAPKTGWFVDEYFYVDDIRYIGYKTLDELYENQIVSKIGSYEYVENIQE